MSTTAVQNLLDSRILGNGEVITYRFVARELKLSADDAKSALKTYMGACDKDLWATYILAGDDINGHRKFVLGPQEALEATKAQFATVSSVHVYSLSSAPRKDASMIAQAARALRETNAKPKPAPARAAPVAARIAESAAAKPAAITQKKPTGKLDWSKAKSKTAPKPAEKPKPAAAAVKKETKPVAVKKEPKPTTVPKPAAVKEEPERAPSKAETKAKSAPKQLSPKSETSDGEDRPVAGGSRLKKRVIISDDEDDEPVKPIARSGAKRKIQESDDEEDEMDVDEPVDMYEDNEPEAKPQRKRQVKTSAPIGSNGRPKKRVVKERMFKDEQGYMQSEDYSDYETDHDEPKEPEKPKPKAKEAKPKEPKAKPAPAAEKPKPAPKKVAGKPGQAKLTNFLKK